MDFFKKTLLAVADMRSPTGPPLVVGPDNRRGSAGDLAKGADYLSCGNQQKRYFRNLERRCWEVSYGNHKVFSFCLYWMNVGEEDMIGPRYEPAPLHPGLFLWAPLHCVRDD